MNTNSQHILIDLNEASKVIIDFIGSEKFDEVVSSIENNAKAGFIAGMSFALCLANANCTTFLCRFEEKKSSEGVEHGDDKSPDCVRDDSNHGKDTQME